MSAAALFDAAAHPGREEEIAALGLEVVARPGMAPPAEAMPGMFAVQRALGEERLATISAVERVSLSRALLEAEGIPCEGYEDGVFIEVEGGPAGRRGLRITGRDRMTARDVVLLRERPRMRTHGAASQARFLEDEAADTQPEGNEQEDGDAPLAALLAAIYALRARRQRTVREEYLRSLLELSSGPSPLDDEMRRGVADLQSRPADEVAARVLAAAERAFILDTQRSALELLEPAERDRYLGFAWHDDDFPGGPTGPNEARADQMFAALTRLRPERRANTGAAAAVRADEFDAAMQRRIEDALTPVPGERG